MSYIEKLQKERGKLIEFYEAFNELQTAHYKWENTAYKADARKIADLAWKKINGIKKEIETMLTKKEKEVVNA